MSGATPDVGVVVVTHNSAAVVLELIRSIPDAFGEIRHRVVVVDNGSTDNTRDLLANRAGVGLVAAANNGYAAGINLGASVLGDWTELLILNPDTRLGHGCVPHLLEATASQVDVGVVVPRIETTSGIDHSLRREPQILRALGLSRLNLPAVSEHYGGESAYDSPRRVDWAVGAAMLVTRQCFESVGGWDESYFLYSEETDFCISARDRGYSTYFQPSAAVFHLEGGSGRSAATHSMQAVNRVRFYRRRHSALASGAYLLLTAAQEGSWALRGHGSSRAAGRALLRPRQRPTELRASSSWLPS